MPAAATAARPKKRFTPREIKTGRARRRGSQLEVGRVLLNDGPLRAQLQGALTDIALSHTIEGASTFTIGLRDHRRALANSDLAKTATRLSYDGLHYRLIKVEKTGDGLNLTFEEEAVYVLRGMTNAKGSPLTIRRKKATRAQFVRMLVREPALRGVRLGDDPHDRPSRYTIPFRAPELRERQLVRGQEPTVTLLDVAPGPAASWEDKIREGNLTVKNQRAKPEQAHNMSLITMYARQFCGAEWGRRAAYIGIAVAVHESTCRNLGWGDRDSVGLFQQRPSQGWGTVADILRPEYACKRFYGYLLPALKRGEGDLEAAETAQWSTIVPPVYWEEAERAADYFWGRQSGGPTSGGGSADQNADGSTAGSGRVKPYSFSRGDSDNKNEDSWDCSGRLAEEVRWRRFMRAGTFWFVSEEWLIQQRPRFRLREFSPGVHEISFNWDARRGTTPMSSFKANAAEASMSFDVRRYGILPGDVVELVGVGTAEGKWLATEVNRTLVSPTSEVTLKRWQEKLPEPPPTRRPPPERNPNVNGHNTPTTSHGGPTGERGEITGDTAGLTFDFRRFVELVAGQYGESLYINAGFDTGGHTVGSRHYTGRAVDINIGAGLDTRQGDLICKAALIVCGVTPRAAESISRQNENPNTNFTINHPVTIRGNAHTVEIGWRCVDHHDHVHLGFQT